MDSRCNLKATVPIVSDKVAKVLIAKNALCEKELSHVRKSLERKKIDCKATIEKEKYTVTRRFAATRSSYARGKTMRDRNPSNNSSSILILLEDEISDSSSSIRSGDLPLQKGPLTTDDNEPLPPKSTTRTKNTRSFTLQQEFDCSGGGEGNKTSARPEIAATTMNMNNNKVNLDEDGKPKRKISMTRSYSTGDLEQTERIAFAQPRSRNQSTSSEHGEGLTSLKGKQREDSRARHNSCDDSFFQNISTMLHNENNVVTKPKPRPKLYSEEPFYLRKKCLVQRWERKDFDKPSLDEFANKEEKTERSLASILPPIALPSIYIQQNGNKNTGTRRTPQNHKRTINTLSLTQNLHDCRYLR